MRDFMSAMRARSRSMSGFVPSAMRSSARFLAASARGTSISWAFSATSARIVTLSGCIQPDSVTILADVAEKAHEIDVPRAEAARKRAEERIADGTNPDMDLERARI